MLKRNLFLIIIAVLSLVFTINTFGQSNKRISSNPKRVKQAKKGVSEWTDILAKKTKSKTKNSRITKKPNQVTGGTIPVYRNGKSSAKRQRAPVKNSFESQTQPFADGRNKRNQRKGGVTHTDSWYPKRKQKN